MREEILPHCSSLVKPQLEYCIQMRSPQYRRDMDMLKRVQRRATKMFQGMEHLSKRGKLTELGLFSLHKGRLQGNLIVAFQYLNWDYKKEGDGLFRRASGDRTREVVSK